MSAKQNVLHFQRADLQQSELFELCAAHAIDPNRLGRLFFFFFSFLICVMFKFISLIFVYLWL